MIYPLNYSLPHFVPDHPSGLRVYRRAAYGFSCQRYNHPALWFLLWCVPTAGWHWTCLFADRLRFYHRYTVGQDVPLPFQLQLLPSRRQQNYHRWRGRPPHLKGNVRLPERFHFCFHRVQMSCLLLRSHRAQRHWLRFVTRWLGGVKQRPSETVFLFSDGLLAQTLRSEYVRSAHILPAEFRFHMGYGLLISDDFF